MAVFRWGHTWDPFRDLEREVDRLLHSVSLSVQGFRFGRQYPAVNVYELEGDIILTAEVAGTRPEDVEVTVSNGVLTIRGKVLGPEGISDDRFRRQERPRGEWQRSIPLPDRIVEEKMTAEFTNGILKIRLPRGAEPPKRSIVVQSGPS